MAKSQHMIASGLSPQSALAIQGGNYSNGGLTATGANKAASLPLPASDNYISLCSAGKGVSLPADAIQGDQIVVYNGGLNACLVYSTIGTTDTITNGSANAGFSVASMKGAFFEKVTGSLWMVNYSA